MQEDTYYKNLLYFTYTIYIIVAMQVLNLFKICKNTTNCIFWYNTPKRYQILI